MNKPEDKPKKSTFYDKAKKKCLDLWGLAKSEYYRIEFQVKYQIRPKEFNVINFKIFGSLTLIVLALYIVLTDRSFFFTLGTKDTQIYIAENVLRTISIFISIVFSFIILSFNIFHKYFGRFTFIKFFTNKYIKFIFSLFIASIILLLYTIAFLKGTPDRTTYGDCIYILSLLISLILVVSVIPTLTLLLRSSQSRNNIEELIKTFDKNWTWSSDIGEIIDPKANKHFKEQRNPINLLIEAGTSAIKDFDRSTLLAIKTGCLEHFQSLQTAYKKKKELHPFKFYKEIDILTRSLYQVAIKERNEIAANIIIDLRYKIEMDYLKNFPDFNITNTEKHFYDGISFMVFMESAFIKALQFNEDSVAENIIDKCREWRDKVLNEYLVSINYDHPEGDFIINEVTSMVSYEQQSIDKMFANALIYKKYHLYPSIASFYRVLELEIIDSKNTRSTKVYLLGRIGLASLQMFDKFFEHIDGEIDSDTYPFGISTTQDLIYIKSHIPFQYELKCFDKILSKGKLNAFVLNNMKATGLHSIRHFLDNENSYAKVLLAIIEKFDKARTVFVNEETDKNMENYLLLEKYLNILKADMIEKKINHAAIRAKIDTVISSFDRSAEYKTKLDAKGYIIKDHLSI